MSDSETASIVELQQRIRVRLDELSFPNNHVAANLERHLAEISVLSRNFFDHTLPLFLTMSTEHSQSLAQLGATMEADLDELRDSLNDVEPDLRELALFLNKERSA
jgi:hypothetical protein